MNLKDFNLNKKDHYILFAIGIFSLILNIYYINFNVDLGIYCSDVYVYLLNSLYFTGANTNSAQTIYLSPVICFLTSILFDLGLKDKLAIIIIQAIFTIIGNLGFYILLKTRFSEVLSLTGTVLYATFALCLTWMANGTIDIPAVSVTIWIVLLSIIAIKSNPKYFQIMIPVFVIGFFTRYTVVLIFPVLVLYYLYNKSFKIEKTDLKYLLRGMVYAILTAAVILIPITLINHGRFEVLNQISGGISGNKGSTADLAYNSDITYYLFNSLNFISSSKVTFANRTPVLENVSIQSYIILLILAAGAILFGLKNKSQLRKEKAVPVLILLFALITFNSFSSFITILIVFLGLLLLGRNSKNKDGLMMAGWILVYLIFFSYFSIKVNRYIIPAIPPFIYLILASIELINEKIKINSNIIPIILIALFLIQGFAFCFAFEDTDQFIAPEEMSDYIKSEIPDFHNQTIGVYNIRPYQWYLGENITGIESDNATKIESGNITYYVSDIPQNNLNGFREVEVIDNLYLYKKTN